MPKKGVLAPNERGSICTDVVFTSRRLVLSFARDHILPQPNPVGFVRARV